MGNGDITGNKQDLGPNSRPGGGNADDAPQAVAPQLTEEELKVIYAKTSVILHQFKVEIIIQI